MRDGHHATLLSESLQAEIETMAERDAGRRVARTTAFDQLSPGERRELL